MIDFKRATIYAAFIYSMIFWVATVLMPLGEKLSGMIMWVFGTLFTYWICKNWYFKAKRPTNKMTDGLMLGVWILLISLAMELLAMAYGLQWGLARYFDFFVKSYIYVTYFLVIVAALAASYMSKK